MNREERLFGFLVNQTSKILQQSINSLFSEAGIIITIEQWPILMILSIYPDSTQQQLAIETNKDKTTVTRIINVMVKNGLLERLVSEKDRRKNKIVVTPKGDEEREKVFEVFCNYDAPLLQGISKEEYDTTMSVLLRIAGNMGESTQVENIYKHMKDIQSFSSKEK